jgi:hypothetical protein
VQTKSGLKVRIDFVAYKNGRMIFFDSKYGTGKISANQREAWAEIRRSGGTFFGNRAYSADRATKRITAGQNLRAETPLNASSEGNALRQRALQALQPLLLELGFRHHDKGVFIGEPDPVSGATGRLGFQSGRFYEGGRHELHPHVGIQLPNLLPIRKELLPEHISSFETSIGQNIGYLMPQNRFHGWTIEPDSDFEAVARSMADAIETYGVPFIQRLSREPEFFLTMVSRMGMPTETAIALLALGRVSEATKVIDAARTQIDDTDTLNGFTDRFDRFVSEIH